jgi:hypothetical protein
VGRAGSGWAQQDDVLFGVQEVELAEVLDHLFLTERWKVKSNSSSVLWDGKRAARIRSRPPEDSLEEISVDSSASAKRS